MGAERRDGYSATIAIAGVVSLSLGGCGAGRPSGTPQDRVFYQSDYVPTGAAPASEWAYPPLDAPEAAPLPGYYGVAIFEGTVRLSRPQSWTIRVVGGPRQRRFVEYVSPRAYLFAVYELALSQESWNDLLDDYQDSATKSGAEFLRQRVPMATANAQGLAYVLRRSVAGPKGPLVNYAHEYVLRGNQRVVLVQVVCHEQVIDGLADELRRVFETLQVL